jgi:hypothetical protein
MGERNLRNDFSQAVTSALARRASYICSNPDCRALTLCPSDEDPIKSIYVGRAAHITAASPGGARYDASLTPAERSDITNGIFLCSVCADKIDKNKGLDYLADMLRRWKSNHETFVRKNLNKSVHSLLGVRSPAVELAFDTGLDLLEIPKRKADKQYKENKGQLSNRIVRIDLRLLNHGSGTATDIDISLNFQGGFQIHTISEVRGLWRMFPLDPFRNPEAFAELLFPKRAMPARERVVLSVAEGLNFAVFESLIAHYRQKLTNSVSRAVAASIDGSRVSFKIAKLKQNLAQPLESLFMVFPSWSSVTSFTIRYRINVEENAVDKVGLLSVVVKKTAVSRSR